ncbi:MAG TPA: SDR family NAD(P)-dependent oxidoreductase, partial [Smithella sp.]|nr:SDR family NAD(P)-dependent oxidoreductase [Smithella sp.]
MTSNGNGCLKGKVAVITGAADGIGRATAVLFARDGAKLVLADLNEKGLSETVDLVKKENAAVISRKTDVAKESDVETLIVLAVETYGQIDILCNNAGITGEFRGLDQESKEDWQHVYEVNVLG